MDRKLSRRKLLRMAGGTGVAALAAGAATVAVASPAQASESGWRWCNKCQGLWLPGGADFGNCPAGNNHVLTGSWNYSVKFNFEGGAGQPGWFFCPYCLGMRYWSGSGSYPGGWCPGVPEYPNAHGLGNQYRIETDFNNDGPGGQNWWLWCDRCYGLWYAGGNTRGVCRSGASHRIGTSWNYIIRPV